MVTLMGLVGIHIEGWRPTKIREGTERMDELRNEIFDYIYRDEGSKSIDEIAIYVDRDGETVRLAVNHDWFAVVKDVVTIAYGQA